jgi:hypothetical protein
MNIGGSSEVVEVGHLEETPGHRFRRADCRTCTRGMTWRLTSGKNE